MSIESKYVSYLKSITQKIKSNKEKYTDRCYKTAMTMLLYFEREYNKHIQKYIINNSIELDYFINNILSPNQNILLDVEYHTSSNDKFTPEKRFDLVDKYHIQRIPGTFYGFAFRKPNIRFINHANNILLTNESVYLTQSWDGLQVYHIHTNPEITSRDTFVQWLKKMFDKLGSSPKNFIDEFDPNYQYSDMQIEIIKNNEKIVDMILGENITYNFRLEIYYVVL